LVEGGRSMINIIGTPNPKAVQALVDAIRNWKVKQLSKKSRKTKGAR
jgi:hypothetical protein